MPKTTLQRALESGYSDFLVSGIRNGTESITQWVEENLIKENSNTGTNKKIAFYEAEKSLIQKYIAEGNFNKLAKLINAIDNEKFTDNPNYQKLKTNECRVLANAIIESERFLKADKIMSTDLNELLNAKYSELTDAGYKDTISGKITEAFSIVDYKEPLEVAAIGETEEV